MILMMMSTDDGIMSLSIMQTEETDDQFKSQRFQRLWEHVAWLRSCDRLNKTTKKYQNTNGYKTDKKLLEFSRLRPPRASPGTRAATPRGSWLLLRDVWCRPEKHIVIIMVILHTILSDQV